VAILAILPTLAAVVVAGQLRRTRLAALRAEMGSLSGAIDADGDGYQEYRDPFGNLYAENASRTQRNELDGAVCDAVRPSGG
jgi:type II secretory pathway pseudopilin PulG